MITNDIANSFIYGRLQRIANLTKSREIIINLIYHGKITGKICIIPVK